MSLISIVGSIFLLLTKKNFQLLSSPMIAFAAGTLLGGAFFHMLPTYFLATNNILKGFKLVILGYILFFILEQFLCWHHCHKKASSHKKPLTYLILIGDGLHNFIGGLSIANTFLINIKLGIISWLAAVAHEISQEIGDFAILVHGGWKKHHALLFNFFSASTFLLGSLVTYFLSKNINVDFLIPFAAGNFMYIATSDLIPEIKKHKKYKNNIIDLFCFLFGITLLYLLKVFVDI